MSAPKKPNPPNPVESKKPISPKMSSPLDDPPPLLREPELELDRELELEPDERLELELCELDPPLKE